MKNALEVVSLRREKERMLVTLRKRLEALNVLYEVSRQSAHDQASPEAVVDRLLAVVGRVLPHDVSAVLVQAHQGRSASLRIVCHATVSEKALLNVKESVLSAYRKTAGVVLPEDRVLGRDCHVADHVQDVSPADREAVDGRDHGLRDIPDQPV